MLVDNAIVIMENIDRIRDEGMDVLNASKFATNQVAPAVLAATLTTMSAFFPMSLTPGMMGEFMKVIPITVMFAIGASFVISLIITPALCSRFLIKHKNTKKIKSEKLEKARKILSVVFVFVLALYAFSSNGNFGILSWLCAIVFAGGMYIKQYRMKKKSEDTSIIISKYLSILNKALKTRKRRIGIVVSAICVLFISLTTIPLGILKIELMPTTDSTNLTINVETPAGYLLEDTGSVVSKVEEILFTYEEIDSFVSKVGNTGSFLSTGDSPNTAEISVDLVESEERERSSMEIMKSLRNDLSNIAGAVSKSDYDNAEISYNQSKLNYEQAQKDLNSNTKSLDSSVDDTIIESPINGVVGKINIEVGEMTTSNDFVIVKIDPVTIESNVSGEVVNMISKGDDVRVSVQSKDYVGKIKSVSPLGTNNSNIYPVEIEIANNDLLLKPGMFADIYFEIEKSENQILIPKKSILTVGSNNYVFIVKDNQPHKISIEKGITNNGYVHVLEGLSIGDELIIKGQEYIEESSAIKLVNETAEVN